MNFSKFLNIKSILFGAGIFAVVIALLGFSGKLPFFDSKSTKEYTGVVRVWGTMPTQSMYDFVSMFNKEAKTYSMQYTEVEAKNISKRLIKAIADGNSPDLIIAPSEIAFENEHRIIPVSVATISEVNYKNIYADIASILINTPNGYIGLPISVDPLVLYYNRDILSTNGFSKPPETWGDLYKYEEKITRKDANNNISLSTIAFGTYDNIPNITDTIISMIFQQEQIPVSKTLKPNSIGEVYVNYIVNMNEPNTDTGISPFNSALEFMMNFSDPEKESYNWNPKFKDAFSQFVSGDVAFYIGFASELGYIKSMNQKLNFDYTYLPQVSGSKVSATYGRLNSIFLLKTSPNKNLAYLVMQYFANQGPYNQALVVNTGGVSVLKADINTAMSSGDQGAEIFGKSALISKNFYDLHRSKLESFIREAIRQVYNGEKTIIEAGEIFSENLQTAYDGEYEE